MLALVSAAPAQPPATGSLKGRIDLGLKGAKLAGNLPLMVYLDGVEGPLVFRAPTRIPVVHQKDARFVPSFLVITVGQTVEMPNDDRIFHNVFSLSKPNQFDLGIYPRGESRKVAFRHPGLVRLFCSMHQSMNATIFVSPSPYYAIVNPEGAFTIRDVPPGRYLLKSWGEKLPPLKKVIEVTAGGTLSLELSFSPSK